MNKHKTVNRVDAPIVINPKAIENDTPTAVRQLNEFIQQLHRRLIGLEETVRQHDEVING